MSGMLEKNLGTFPERMANTRQRVTMFGGM